MGSRLSSLHSLFVPLLLALASCSADPAPEAKGQAGALPPAGTPQPIAMQPESTNGLAQGFAPVAFDLAGTSWLVVAVNGEAMAERYSDLATVHFTGAMIYWQACNHHEALYVRTRTSFALGRAVAARAACPAYSPDHVMSAILGSRPLIGSNAEGKVMLIADQQSMTLSQIETRYSDLTPPPAEAGPFRLVTGENGARPPVLSFSGHRFSVWMDCPDAISGTVSLRRGKLMTGDVAQGECTSHRQTAIRALKAFLADSPAIARGPKGELMLSNGETVIHGQQCFPDSEPCAYARESG